MQTKSKLKSKKTSQIISIPNNNLQQVEEKKSDKLNEEFVQIGGICGDGTFTQKIGRGAGSRHGGIKHKLYIKKSQINQNQKIAITSSVSTTSSMTCSKCEQRQEQKSKSPQIKQLINLSSSSIKKQRNKKISLKELIKTKTKRNGIYERVNVIFDSLYKDEFELVEQQISDQLWIVISAICNLYDELQQSNDKIKSLQVVKNINEQKKELSSNKKKKNKNQGQMIQQSDNLSIQIRSLQREKGILSKQVQKMNKLNNRLSESILIYKDKQKGYKKILKMIQKQNEKLMIKVIEQLNIDMKQLLKSVNNKKSNIQDEQGNNNNNRMITRSMANNNKELISNNNKGQNRQQQILQNKQSTKVNVNKQTKANKQHKAVKQSKTIKQCRQDKQCKLNKQVKQKRKVIKQNKKQIKQSIFISSDNSSSDFYDQDHTILNLIKSIKQ